MTLTIPEHMQKHIQQRLNALPAINGKICLHLTFNCANQKIGSMKILESTEEEIRT